MPLRQKLADYAITQPERTAVTMGVRKVGYGALFDRAMRLDSFVHGLKRQERSQHALRGVPLFALLMGNSPQIPEFLAAALAGNSCMMLLDPSLPKAQLEDILATLTPDVLFTTHSPEGAPKTAAPTYQVNTDSDVDRLLTKPNAPPAPAPENAPFMVAFTSGTTSRPKAFVRDRASWQRSFSRGRSHFDTGPHLHTLSPGPLVHGLSHYAFAETLDAGATFHGMQKFTPEAVADRLLQFDIKRLVCVPTMLEALTRHGAPLPALQQITTAGAKLNAGLLNKTQKLAPNAQVTEYYGASELGFVTTVTHQGAPDPDAMGVGQAFPGLDLEIRNPNADGTGEIWVKSDLVIDDYLWREDQSGFQTDGLWCSVGDIGRLDEHGNLHLLSRAGGMIISGGNNIFPDEISAFLKTHPKISEAVALGLDDSYLGQSLVAVIDADQAPALSELLHHCQSGLQKYKIPRAFYVIEKWPMTTSGKISTRQLAEMIRQKDDRLAQL